MFKYAFKFVILKISSWKKKKEKKKKNTEWVHSPYKICKYAFNIIKTWK